MALIKPGEEIHGENAARVTAKAEAFLQRFVANGRNTEDAEQFVGYTPGYGRQVLAKDNNRKRLAEIMQVSADQLGVYQRQVLEEVAALAFSDITEIGDPQSLEDLQRLPARVRHSIQRIEWENKVVFEGSGKNRKVVTRRLIKRIHMHPKQQNLQILAEATQLVRSEKDRGDQDRPVFTGFNVITSQAAKQLKK